MNRQIECSGPAFPDLINTARKIPLLLVTGGQFFLNTGYCLKDALIPGFNTNELFNKNKGDRKKLWVAGNIE